MHSAEFWFVQYCFVAKLSVGYVNTRDDHNSKRQHVYEAKAICWSKLLELKMCYLYFFCLHCLINIHIFDYPDSRLSGLFTLVPPTPDNRGSTVCLFFFKETWNRSRKLELHNKADFDNSLPPTIRGNLKSISASQSGYAGFTCHISTYYQCPKKDTVQGEPRSILC